MQVTRLHLDPHDPRGFNHKKPVHQYLSPTGLHEGQQIVTPLLPFLHEGGDLVVSLRADQAISVMVEAVKPGTAASHEWTSVEDFELVSDGHAHVRYAFPPEVFGVRFVLKAHRACKAVSIFTQVRKAELA